MGLALGPGNVLPHRTGAGHPPQMERGVVWLSEDLPTHTKQSILLQPWILGRRIHPVLDLVLPGILSQEHLPLELPQRRGQIFQVVQITEKSHHHKNKHVHLTIKFTKYLLSIMSVAIISQQFDEVSRASAKPLFFR